MNVESVADLLCWITGSVTAAFTRSSFLKVSDQHQENENMMGEKNIVCAGKDAASKEIILRTTLLWQLIICIPL